MSNYKCNNTPYDVWDKEYQERLVDYHGHEFQVTKAICEDVKPTPQEAYGDLSKWIIKS